MTKANQNNTVNNETTLTLSAVEKEVLLNILKSELVSTKGIRAVFSKGDSASYVRKEKAIESIIKKL